MPAFSMIRRKKAKQAAMQAEYDEAQRRLGPPPAPPPSILQNESFAQAAGMVARSEYARRRARPINAITARPAAGAQQQIRRAAKPGY
jgi:hypothetical protein